MILTAKALRRYKQQTIPLSKVHGANGSSGTTLNVREKSDEASNSALLSSLLESLPLEQTLLLSIAIL